MGALEEHFRVGAPQEPGSVLLTIRSQWWLLPAAAIAQHPDREHNMVRQSLTTLRESVHAPHAYLGPRFISQNLTIHLKTFKMNNLK